MHRPFWNVSFALNATMRSALSAIFILLAMALPAYAQPRFIGVSLAPLDPQTTVEMISQAIDVTIGGTDSVTSATVHNITKLHNPDLTSPVTVVLGFPGWAGGDLAFRLDALVAFEITVDGTSVQLQRTTADLQIGSEKRTVDWYTWSLAFDPDEKKVIEISYHQDLGPGSIVTFTHGLATSAGWHGAIGSIRLTLRLPEMTSPEQLVSATPAYTEFDGQAVTWSFVNVEPRSNIRLAFIRPSVWRNLVAARDKASQEPDSAQAHYALGALYKSLAADAPQFFALAVGEYEQAKKLDPALVVAHLDLAAMYESKMVGADGRCCRGDSSGQAYLALATSEWEEVLRLDAGNTLAQDSLARDDFYLAGVMHEAGRYEEALGYLDRAVALRPNGQDPAFTKDSAEKQQQAILSAWAKVILESGSAAERLAGVKSGPWADVLKGYESSQPALAATSGVIDTTAGQREMMITLAPYPSLTAVLNAKMRTLQSALAAQPGITVRLDYGATGYVLRLTVPFRDGADLKARLGAMAAAVPDEPDFAPLAAILRPTTLEITESDGLLSREVLYRETIDLARVGTVLDAKSTEVESELAKVKASASSGDDAVRQVRLKLLGEYAATWKRLRDESCFSYSVTLPVAGDHAWSVSIGKSLAMEASGRTVKPLMLGLGVLAAVALLVLIRLVWQRRA